MTFVFKPFTLRVWTGREKVFDLDIGHLQIGNWRGALFAIWIYSTKAKTYSDADILYLSWLYTKLKGTKNED